MANYQGPSRIPSGGGPGHSLSDNAVLTRGYEAAQRCVEDHPASSVGVAFGAGLGVGLCVGLALKAAVVERRTSHRSVTERLGRQVLDAMASVLPESLGSRITR